MLTAKLGTPQSQPGTLQPGFFCTGFGEWRGPFQPAEVGGYALTPAQPLDLLTGTFVVPLAVASQMAAADVNWWVFH